MNHPFAKIDLINERFGFVPLLGFNKELKFTLNNYFSQNQKV